MKNEYIISLNTKGLQCQNKRQHKKIKDFTELNKIIDNFISLKFTIKIDNNNLILENCNTIIFLKDYSSLIEYSAFEKLKSSINETIKNDGFTDISNKNQLNKKIKKNKDCFQIVKTVGTILTLLGFTSGFSLGLLTNNTLFQEKEEIMSNIIKKPNVNISIIEKRQILTLEKMYLNALRELSNNNYHYGYLNFTNKSNSTKAVNARNNYYDVMCKCAKELGLDPDLILAIATQESGLHSANIYEDENHVKRGAVGLMQIMYEVWAGSNVTYYSYNETTKTFYQKTITVTEDTLTSIEGNILIGSIILQRCMIAADYNIPAAIQMYNQGVGGASKSIKAYASNIGSTYDEVLHNPNDLGWLQYTSFSAGDAYYLSHINSWSNTNYFKVINVFNLEEVKYKFTNDPDFSPIDKNKIKVMALSNQKEKTFK